jgi:menaquinol-cytochrome c reductase iron-sulfur subunit
MNDSGRRNFLRALVATGTALVGGLLSIPLFRFFLFPVTHQTTDKSWSDLGPLEEYANRVSPIRKTIQVEQLDGWRKLVSEKAVYVLRSQDGAFRVLSPVCPHLGCLISWDEKKERFLSPCHGGVFKSDGALVSGPPKRGMDELPSKQEAGRLWVQYQYFRPLVATREPIA